jgi:hypothetical protein
MEYKAKHGEMPKAVPDPKYSAFADDPDFEPTKRLYVGRNVKVRIANNAAASLASSTLANVKAHALQNASAGSTAAKRVRLWDFRSRVHPEVCAGVYQVVWEGEAGQSRLGLEKVD